MFTKALKSLKSINPNEVLAEIKAKSEKLSEATRNEKERLLDRVVERILEGQDLGGTAAEIRASVRKKLFEQTEGDVPVLSNLRYLNEVLTSSKPQSLHDVTTLKDKWLEKIIEDARKSLRGKGVKSKPVSSTIQGRRPSASAGSEKKGGRRNSDQELSADSTQPTARRRPRRNSSRSQKQSPGQSAESTTKSADGKM